MAAVDTFNSPAEAAVATQSAALAPGTHPLCIRGQDAANNWGEWTCRDLIILTGGGDVIPPDGPVVTQAVLADGAGTDDDVVIDWDKSFDEGQPGGTIEYQVWRATTNFAGPYMQIGTIPAINSSTYTYTCVGCGFGDTNTYFFEIRSVDNVSNSATAIEVAAKYSASPVAGKNLLTVPIHQADYALTEVFQTIWSEVDVIRTFRAADGLDPWKAYYAVKPGDLTTAGFAEAYWVHLTAPVQFVLAGLVDAAPSVGLEPGWNFVSYASFTSVDSQTSLAAVASVARVETLGNPADPYSLMEVAGTDLMVPGGGYWVWITGASQIWSQ